MNNVSINYEALETSITMLDNEIKKLEGLFEKQNNNYELLKDSTVWNSPSREVCIEKYNELASNYKTVIDDLNKYRNFLSGVHDTYKTYEATTDKMVSSISN
jgi:phage-related tail protein